MPSRPVGVTDAASGTTVAEIDVIERPSPDLTTTTTADRRANVRHRIKRDLSMAGPSPLDDARFKSTRVPGRGPRPERKPAREYPVQLVGAGNLEVRDPGVLPVQLPPGFLRLEDSQAAGGKPRCRVHVGIVLRIT